MEREESNGGDKKKINLIMDIKKIDEKTDMVYNYSHYFFYEKGR